eukprot:4393101-Lingulodinium_polyedra.AAC.1
MRRSVVSRPCAGVSQALLLAKVHSVGFREVSTTSCVQPNTRPEDADAGAIDSQPPVSTRN